MVIYNYINDPPSYRSAFKQISTILRYPSRWSLSQMSNLFWRTIKNERPPITICVIPKLTGARLYNLLVLLLVILEVRQNHRGGEIMLNPYLEKLFVPSKVVFVLSFYQQKLDIIHPTFSKAASPCQYIKNTVWMLTRCP